LRNTNLEQPKKVQIHQFTYVYAENGNYIYM